jgi:hypothetical protein
MISYTMLTSLDEMYASGAFVTDGTTIRGVGSAASFLEDKERLAAAEAALSTSVADGLGVAFGKSSSMVSDGPHESSFADLDTACETLDAFLKRLNDELYGNAEPTADKGGDTP